MLLILYSLKVNLIPHLTLQMPIILYLYLQVHQIIHLLIGFFILDAKEIQS
jgi:hypothetical protein